MPRVQDGPRNVGSRLQRWLAPPAFPGYEDRTRHAVILNASLLTAIVLMALLYVGDVIGGRIPFGTREINLVMIAACLALRYLMQRGRVSLVGAVSLALGIVANTFSIADLGTIRSPSTTVYLLLVVVGGLLFDFPGVFATTAASSLAVLGLIVAQNNGALPPADYSVTISQWVTFTALFGLVGGLTLYSVRRSTSGWRNSRSV
ncbi:MAG: hypothetical protein M1482_06585, partial [Chloroflexi bacterium]|nr:hypothetical protein [Chloroflexota bacterium]